jgi:hypothetical protein
MARVGDFLRDGETLTVADLTNRKTHEANYNAGELTEILAGFRTTRLRLVDRVETFQPLVFTRALLHPRLKQPMRLWIICTLLRSTTTIPWRGSGR